MMFHSFNFEWLPMFSYVGSLWQQQLPVYDNDNFSGVEWGYKEPQTSSIAFYGNCAVAKAVAKDDTADDLIGKSCILQARTTM